MKRINTSVYFILLVFFSILLPAQERDKNKMDEYVFGNDKIKITFYGHASLMINFNGENIFVDPVSMFIKNDTLPKADLILITHEHQDHFDSSLIQKISKDSTEIVTNRNCAAVLKKGTALENGQKCTIKNIGIEAVPAYNTTKGNERFHPKARDNGYILTLGTKKIYIAGDTEDIPEMAQIKNIDIAFLPVNQPYTMTIDQIANAVKMIMPKIVYPYHIGDTDIPLLESTLKKIKGTEILIREMQ
jgi:L-ascorbate metabolism protein UlaG (beta-lactamase superfamily)